MDFTTDKEYLETNDIEAFIQAHQRMYSVKFASLWNYYIGKNTAIMQRKVTDPDNKTPFPYGRKIVNTYTGYAWRPGYTTYRAHEESSDAYVEAVNANFRLNHESIKTQRAGRNTAIFGRSYELHYIDGVVDNSLSVKATPRFFSVDPREMILIYDESPEPQKKFAIRYTLHGNDYLVEVYDDESRTLYSRSAKNSGSYEYSMVDEPEKNFYGAVPVTPFYMGDEMTGLIDPVISLIDDYDLIVSDSMIEFSRFANAYLRLVGMSIGDPTGQNPKILKQMLDKIRKARVFDNLKSQEDVSFLTKDIPTPFIDYMASLLDKQIFKQSHVPDFGSEAFKGALSGAAIERMLFDFENVVSSAESDFDIGLYDRISLVSKILELSGQSKGDPSSIVIDHRRNIPLDELDSAIIAQSMRGAGLSMETTLESMPRAMVPNVQEELERQESEKAGKIPDLDADIGKEAESVDISKEM